jgi:isopenicillin-N epimerase
MTDFAQSGANRFGHPLRSEWLLDPEIVYLNHGTVGATPRVVLEVQEEIRREIERQPADFMLRKLVPLVGAGPSIKGQLREAAETVAAYLGARGDDLVFVENATTAVNAVLRSFSLEPGDEVLVTDHTYGAVANAATYACRRADAKVVRAELPYPVAEPEEVVAAVAAALSPRTRLAILDHITSDTAIVLPVAALTALCRDRGVKVLIDGAHAPGMLDLDIPALGADWYTGNLHKWLFAPRGCALLWAREDAQQDLHPAVVSWGLDAGFTAEFDWTGTRDPSPYLAAPRAIGFLERLGAKDVFAYNHDLVRAAAGMLAERWGTVLGVPETMTGSMTMVPLPDGHGTDKAAAEHLRDKLLFEACIEVPVMAWRDRLWLRLSAQVYNEMADFERLAAVISA